MKYNDTYSIVDMIKRKSQYDKKPNSMPFISFLLVLVIVLNINEQSQF